MDICRGAQWWCKGNPISRNHYLTLNPLLSCQNVGSETETRIFKTIKVSINFHFKCSISMASPPLWWLASHLSIHETSSGEKHNLLINISGSQWEYSVFRYSVYRCDLKSNHVETQMPVEISSKWWYLTCWQSNYCIKTIKFAPVNAFFYKFL